jgi:pimeloyl-ACP methyl ester carboxylesterase
MNELTHCFNRGMPWLLIVLASLIHADDLPRRASLGILFSEPGIVHEVVPGSAAEQAGIKPDDVIMSIDSLPLTAGKHVTVKIKRAGNESTLDAVAKEYPRETSTDYDTLYGSVKIAAGRLRTIITKPHGNGRFPAVFIVQGGGCVSVDNIPHNWTNDIVRELTKHGYATMRVDKPGVGDSEGGPCNSAPFDRELAGYRAALEAFRAAPNIDTKHLYLFAHSLGGTFAPYVAASMRLRGIAVYGAAFAQRPEFNDGMDKFGKDGSYWRSIYNLDVAKRWRAFHGVLLAMWGSRDTATTIDEHRALVAIHPDKSRFVTIDGTDHFNFAPDVLKTLIPWLDSAR